LGLKKLYELAPKRKKTEGLIPTRGGEGERKSRVRETSQSSYNKTTKGPKIIQGEKMGGGKPDQKCTNCFNREGREEIGEIKKRRIKGWTARAPTERGGEELGKSRRGKDKQLELAAGKPGGVAGWWFGVVEVPGWDNHSYR